MRNSVMGSIETLLYIVFAYIPWIFGVIASGSIIIGIIRKHQGKSVKKCGILAGISIGVIILWVMIILGVVMMVAWDAK
ncbi:MAG: hypothetical protein ACRDDX_00040 [Cellulosilyticaceae bacterium]